MNDGLDYRGAFDFAPVGLVLSRQRLMIDCNRELLAMFGAQRDQIVGHSFEVLYPTADEPWRRDHYDGAYRPGTYLGDREAGEVVMQFFHLLPPPPEGTDASTGSRTPCGPAMMFSCNA